MSRHRVNRGPSKLVPLLCAVLVVVLYIGGYFVLTNSRYRFPAAASDGTTIVRLMPNHLVANVYRPLAWVEKQLAGADCLRVVIVDRGNEGYEL